jgi:hypothetical protein
MPQDYVDRQSTLVTGFMGQHRLSSRVANHKHIWLGGPHLLVTIDNPSLVNLDPRVRQSKRARIRSAPHRNQYPIILLGAVFFWPFKRHLHAFSGTAQTTHFCVQVNAILERDLEALVEWFHQISVRACQ